MATNIQEVRFCRRLAVKVNQGIGWSEYTGDGWVVPYTDGGAVIVQDENSTRRLIIDCSSDTAPGLYEVGTYDQVSYAGLPYVDKENKEDGNIEIEWSRYCNEIVATATRQNDTLESLETHVFVRPQLPYNKGNAAYNENGFRDGFELGLEVYADGEVRTPLGIVRDIPVDGDITFSGTKVEGRRLMFKVNGSASECKVTTLNHYLLSKPRPVHLELSDYPDMQDEEAFAKNLVFWMSRGKLGYDRISKTYVLSPESTFGVEIVTGLGNIPYSAISTTISPTMLTTFTLSTAGMVVFCSSNTKQPLITGYSAVQYSESWDGYWIATITLPAGTYTMKLEDGVWYDLRIFSINMTDYLQGYYNNMRYGNGDGYLPTK